MEFAQYIEKSWQDHATNTELVFNSLNDGEALITTNENIPVLARLIAHVCGDHLGRWQAGIDKLQKLKSNPHFLKNTESEASIDRLIATLLYSSGELRDVSAFSTSDQVRIFAQSAAMLSEHGDLLTAEKNLTQALHIAQELGVADPAHRALAITGNNLACTLEEKAGRSNQETDLMILSAKVGRKYWEIAGGSAEVSSAEYRLAKSYLQASQFEKGREHARLSLKVCEENKNSNLDRFYAFEVVALSEKALGNESEYLSVVEKMKAQFSQLSDSDKKSCEKTARIFFARLKE